jgi:4-hydroxybenzoate polyprenyltransferase
MLVVGVALAGGAAAAARMWQPGAVALLLAACVFAYDSTLKRTPAGPLAMGACRLLNVLLGMSVSPEPWQAVHWAVAGGVGLYIVGVTLFARREAAVSTRIQLIAGTLILLGGIALLSSAPRWATGTEWPPVVAPPRWYVFWGLIGLLIAWRCLRAVLEPRPGNVQAAVRNCIFALVILDAGAVLAVQDRAWALVILALLIPTVFLGRWIYST